MYYAPYVRHRPPSLSVPARLAAACAIALVGCASPAPAVPQATTPAPTPAAPAPAPLVHVQILAFNDFHGNLEPPEGHDGSVVAPGGGRIAAGGASYLAAHVKSLRRANPNTVVVSAGDLTGASPLVSNLFDDEPTVLLMNQLGLDFEAVGNHDFDRGLAELVRLSKGGTSAVAGGGTNGAKAGSALVARPPFAGARYHYLAANVRGADGNTVFPPYEVRELAGARVAFVGMTLKDTPSVTTRDPVAGLTFADEAATANALLPELRAQGIAATVLLVHEGGFQDEKGSYDSCSGLGGEILPVLRRLDPSFRVVITGHTHQAYDCVIDGRRVTSAASYGRLVGLQIRAGFLKAANQRLGGPVGCTHIRELLQQVATTAFQSMWQLRAKRKSPGGAADEDGSARLLNTCFAYASSSPAVAKRWPHLHTGPDALHPAGSEGVQSAEAVSSAP